MMCPFNYMEWARDLSDTQDLVQETVFAAFTQIDRFDARGPGALQAYLRQALNRPVERALFRLAKQMGARTLKTANERPIRPR